MLTDPLEHLASLRAFAFGRLPASCRAEAFRETARRNFVGHRSTAMLARFGPDFLGSLPAQGFMSLLRGTYMAYYMQ